MKKRITSDMIMSYSQRKLICRLCGIQTAFPLCIFDLFLRNWRKAGPARSRLNLQGTQIIQKPTAWAHAVFMCAQAFFICMSFHLFISFLYLIKSVCRNSSSLIHKLQYLIQILYLISDGTESEAFMTLLSLEQELRSNSYPGRGIIIGRTPDGARAVTAYFIMGRSQNSRNRIFVEDGNGIRTQAYDPSKLEDPSLIIYAPVRVLGNKTIVTNGDQTDTIYEGMDHQMTFEQSLRRREFEPDAPNYTPRISGILHTESGHYNYAMSILKSNCGNPDSCHRYTFAYENPRPGEGHFIHTYMQDGDPLPSFEGEPKLISVPDDMDAFADLLWTNLNEENKVSLFVRYIDIATGTWKSRIINKNQ